MSDEIEYVRCVICNRDVDVDTVFVVDTRYDSDDEGWVEDCVCKDCYEEDRQ